VFLALVGDGDLSMLSSYSVNISVYDGMIGYFYMFSTVPELFVNDVD